MTNERKFVFISNERIASMYASLFGVRAEYQGGGWIKVITPDNISTRRASHLRRELGL